MSITSLPCLNVVKMNVDVVHPPGTPVTADKLFDFISTNRKNVIVITPNGFIFYGHSKDDFPTHYTDLQRLISPCNSRALVSFQQIPVHEDVFLLCDEEARITPNKDRNVINVTATQLFSNQYVSGTMHGVVALLNKDYENDDGGDETTDEDLC